MAQQDLLVKTAELFAWASGGTDLLGRIGVARLHKEIAGEDELDDEDWQELCSDVGADPAQGWSLVQFRKLLEEDDLKEVGLKEVREWVDKLHEKFPAADTEPEPEPEPELEHGQASLHHQVEVKVPSLILAVGGNQQAFYLKLLQSQEQQHKMLRCKLMFVGSGHAGKTSVKLRLTGMGFNEKQDSTAGIEVDVETWAGGSGGGGGVSDFKEAVGKQLAVAQRAQEAKEAAAKARAAEAAQARAAAAAARRVAPTPRPAPPQLDPKPVLQQPEPEPNLKAEAELELEPEPEPEPELDLDPELEPELTLAVLQPPQAAAPKPQPRHEPEPEPEREPEPELERRSSFSMDDYAAVVARILSTKPIATKKMTLLDFAGQRMYYQMHHIFVTPKLSIYVAVFSLESAPGDALEGEDAECGLTQLQNLHFWLNSVHAQAPEAPIIVVGTHRASLTDNVAAERLAVIEASFERTAFYDQLRNGGKVFCVDNKVDDDSTFDALRELIAVEQDALPGFDDQVPLRWLRFLDVLQEGGEQYISLGKAAEIATHLHIAERRELMLMLKLFTDVGLLMHFDVDGLREMVVLQPQWLLNNMRNLLCLRHLDSMIGEAEQGTEKAELLDLKAKVDNGTPERRCWTCVTRACWTRRRCCLCCGPSCRLRTGRACCSTWCTSRSAARSQTCWRRQ